MDKYRNHNYNYIKAHSPSFSSTLLDQIYRSIDETNDQHVAGVDDELVFYKGSAMTVKKKKQYISTTVEVKNEADFQLIENWMEKRKGSEKITKTSSEKFAVTDYTYSRKIGEKYGSFVKLNSSWSSSDSSSGGLFSSEAEESHYGASSRSSSSTTTYKPKSIKTSIDFKKILRDKEQDHDEAEAGGVVKRSKLKALKIYSDLKKAKQQPISPGAKIATFLNSLFTTGNARKSKISGGDSLTTSPACSTSRSCLSKSPRKLSSNGTKRSVRFYPVSVIVDEDCQPCGHKSLQSVKNRAVPDHSNSINEELMNHMKRKEAAKELLKNYQRKLECEMEVEDEDDDDNDSYASSDLFELDNLNNNGIHVLGNYMEELPVYETTFLHTNRAIANTLVA